MSDEPAVPEPSYLPPNPSVGELVTEIDRARHEAARTVAALVEKFDVKTRVQRKARDRMAALPFDGPRIATELRTMGTRAVGATPESVAKAMGTALQYAKRIPVPVQLLAAVVLLRWIGTRRRR
jgi:hypothetical protein